MSEYQVFLTLVGFHLLAVMSPGPDMAIVMRYGLLHGKVCATYTAVGIGTGILVHVFYSVLGLGLILEARPYVFTLLKFLGVLYLLYLAYLGARGGYVHLSMRNSNGWTEGVAVRTPSRVASFRTGFLTNALNIKATMFFVSVYLLVVQNSPLALQILYGVYMAVATGIYFSVLAQLAGRLRPFLRAYMGQVEIVTALLLALLALSLAWFSLDSVILVR